MNTISYAIAKCNLEAIMSQVCDKHEPVVIVSDEKSVVLLSLEDYKSLEETNYLLRMPENARRLLESITELNRL